MFTQFIRDERGSTAIEYGLLASLLALIAITAIRSVGEKMRVMYIETIAESLPS